MKIKLKSRWIYNENIITAGCPRSEALFELLENRKTLKVKDLPNISKMGFEIELIGDTQPLIKEISSSEMGYRREDGKVIPEN